MPQITPFLWFNDNAEAAMDYYVAHIPNTHIISQQRHPDGSLFIGEISLNGTRLQMMNAGNHYQLTPAFSLSLICENQEEVDRYWKALSDGGKEMICAWVTDKFGLTWQVVPQALITLLNGKDRTRAAEAQKNMMTMKKIVVADL